MSDAIDDLIDANIFTTLEGIKIVGGFANNFVVDREKPLPDPPDSIMPTDVYCMIIPGDVQPTDGNPLKKSDFLGTWFFNCYVYEPIVGGEWSKRMRSIHWDVRRALMTDYQRGTHPLTGSKLAIWTRIPVARPMDMSQDKHRGVIIQADVKFRTAQDDGFNQA